MMPANQTTKADNKRVQVTFDDAVKRLPDSDDIHTFRCGSGILIGADWRRAEILEAMQRYPVELSGKMATGMDHGLCLCDEHGWLFIATKEATTNAS